MKINYFTLILLHELTKKQTNNSKITVDNSVEN